jgi:hypothetical protein
MAKKKQLSDKKLIEACGGVQAVKLMLGFSTTAAVYNWIGSDEKRRIPRHWRMLLENKVAQK